MNKKVWHIQSVDVVLKTLEVTEKEGLSMAEAAKRLSFSGANQLKEGKKDCLAMVFLKQFCDFMVMVLLGAAIISAAFGEVTDALMIMAIIVLNGVLGFVQEYKAEKSMEALKTLYIDEALVVREGKKEKINGKDLVVGDIVYLRQGDKVPADLRVLWEKDLQTEESALTGEAKPVSKNDEVLFADCPLAERKNMCYSGTTVVRGQACGVVVATGMDTEIGKIAAMLNQVKPGLTPLQKRLKHLGKALIFLCILVCALVSVIGIISGGNVYTMVMTGVSLGVASIPEGLPAIVTICLALGVWRLAKGNAIVKKLPSVETLGSTTVICTDKTGTLTENKMSVKSLFVDGAWRSMADIALTSSAVKDSLSIMMTCNSLQKIDEKISGDATEAALFQGASSLLKKEEIPPHDGEIAFTAKRRRMSVLLGHTSLVKGAPDVVLELCENGKKEDEILPLFGVQREKLLMAAEEYSAKGYRVLALAKRERVKNKEDMERGLTFISLVAMEDAIRDDVYDAITKAKCAGIKVVMVTGDHKGTAVSVGSSLGMVSTEEQVALGKEIPEADAKEDNIKNKTIFARVAPEDKMKLVRYYKNHGEVVAMTGDGVNDAPALKEANIGIAMGKRGADVAKEAADFILTDDAFSTIVDAIYQGRGIYDNIRKFIRYLLSSNLGEVLTMFLSVLFGLPLPLLPLQILWINLVTDGLPALALGMEPPNPALMEQQPTKTEESIFAHGLKRRIFIRGIIIGFTAIFMFIYGVFHYNIDVARTMTFTALVFSQLFYVFDCRSEHDAPISLSVLKNPWLLGAVGISVVMQCFAVYLPWCQSVFHTAPLYGKEWSLIIVVTMFPTLVASFFAFFKKQKKSMKKQEITTLCRRNRSQVSK